MYSSTTPVDEFTTPDPITASETAGITELRQLMDAHGIRHLPITRAGAVVGLVSERDLRLAAGLARDHREQVRASDIMATELLTVTADTPIVAVARQMSEQKVGSAIVNETGGAFFGIFTATDALNALIEIGRSSQAPGR